MLEEELVEFFISRKIKKTVSLEKRREDLSEIIDKYFKKNKQSRITRESLKVLTDELGFTITNISTIGRFERHFLPVIENLIANTENLKILQGIGFKASNLSTMFHDSTSGTGDVTSQLTLPENLRRFRILLTPLGEDTGIVDDSGVAIKGAGLGASSLASLLSGARAHIEDIITQLTLPENLRRFRILLTPLGEDTGIVDDSGVAIKGAGLGSANLPTMLRNSKKDIQGNLSNIFAIQDYFTSQGNSHIVKLAINKIGLNGDPRSILEPLSQFSPKEQRLVLANFVPTVDTNSYHARHCLLIIGN